MIKEKLKQDAKLLEKQLAWLKLSCDECKIISIKENYSDALVDVFDEVLEYSEKLILIIENTLAYIDSKTK